MLYLFTIVCVLNVFYYIRRYYTTQNIMSKTLKLCLVKNKALDSTHTFLSNKKIIYMCMTIAIPCSVGIISL